MMTRVAVYAVLIGLSYICLQSHSFQQSSMRRPRPMFATKKKRSWSTGLMGGLDQPGGSDAKNYPPLSRWKNVLHRFDAVESSQLQNIQMAGLWGRVKSAHNPVTYLILAGLAGFRYSWCFRSPYYWFGVGFLIKWYRARYVFKIPVWDRQPNWNNIITSKEQEKDLRAMTCKNCGSTLFIAKTREFFFEGATGIGGLGCFSCGAKGKDNFVENRDEILEDVAELDDYFEYERPLDFVSRAERREVLKQAKGDEDAANQLLLARSSSTATDEVGGNTMTDMPKANELLDAEIVEEETGTESATDEYLDAMDDAETKGVQEAQIIQEDEPDLNATRNHIEDAEIIREEVSMEVTNNSIEIHQELDVSVPLDAAEAARDETTPEYLEVREEADVFIAPAAQDRDSIKPVIQEEEPDLNATRNHTEDAEIIREEVSMEVTNHSIEIHQEIDVSVPLDAAEGARDETTPEYLEVREEADVFIAPAAQDLDSIKPVTEAEAFQGGVVRQEANVFYAPPASDSDPVDPETVDNSTPAVAPVMGDIESKVAESIVPVEQSSLRTDDKPIRKSIHTPTPPALSDDDLDILDMDV